MKRNLSVLRRMLTILGVCIGLLAVLPAHARIVVPPAPVVNAKGFILMDPNSGNVIAEQNADIAVAPASLTKIMTVYVVGKELQSGNISLDDEVTISENAWAKNFPDSSKMFIEVGTTVTLSELLQGVIVQSGNDACVAVAEYVAGSESAFADMMNAYAQQLGMTSSNFVNSHGLDDPGHRTSPRDMALLTAALIEQMPQVYEFYSQKEFTYNDIKQFNRNSLLWDPSLSVDGVKTGYTSDAGYSLITSATQGEMRLVSVVMGTESVRARKTENKKLLRYGFRFYETVVPYESGTSFVNHRIYGGNRDTVELGILDSTLITIPRGSRDALEADFVLDQKLEAPLDEHQIVGELFIRYQDEVLATYPLVTLQEVKKGNVFKRALDFFNQKLDDQ